MMQMTKPRPRRIGEILVSHGVLTEEQVQEILREQQRGGRPFGDLAERLFNISAETVERAWIEQYLRLGTEVDLDEQPIQGDALRVINRRQAWQFRMLPVTREDGEIIAATTREGLKRAVNFAWRRFDEPVFFVITTPEQLERALMRHYPWPSALNLPAAG